MNAKNRFQVKRMSTANDTSNISLSGLAVGVPYKLTLGGGFTPGAGAYAGLTATNNGVIVLEGFHRTSGSDGQNFTRTIIFVPTVSTLQVTLVDPSATVNGFVMIEELENYQLVTDFT